MPATAVPRPARDARAEWRAARVRINLFLTPEQHAAFLVARAQAGHTDHSAFVVEALGLDAPQTQKGPGR